jgi:hypothetical protein
MLWVTRPSPHIDRTACAWLIRRFIDADATFAFAADPAGAAGLGGTPFDMRGVALGHHEGRCSFETILHTYKIEDPALDEIAAMVHDADLDDDRFRSPEAPGLDAVIRGLGLVIPDDHELLRYTERIYDGLYEWAQRLTR